MNLGGLPRYLLAPLFILVQVIQCKVDVISLDNLVKGDILTLAPFNRLDTLNSFTTFFPQQPSTTSPAWPVSRPVFRSKVTQSASGQLDHLMAYLDKHDFNTDSYNGNVYIQTSNSSVQRWDLSGNLQEAPSLSLVAWADLEKLNCRQMFSVPIGMNNRDEHNELVYCLQKDHLLKMEGLPIGGGSPIFFSSLFTTDGINKLLMKPTFSYLHGNEGQIKLAYNYLDVTTDSGKDYKNNVILFVLQNDHGKLYEKVFELSKSSFIDGMEPSSLTHLSILSAEISPDIYPCQVILAPEEGSYHVYQCMFNLDAIQIQSCSEVGKLKKLGSLVDVSLSHLHMEDSSSVKYKFELLSDNSKGIYSTLITCSAIIHKEKPQVECKTSDTKDYAIAEVCNLDKLYVASNNQGVRNYYRNKQFAPESLVFSEIITNGGAQFIYGNESASLITSRNNLTVGVNKEGFLSIYLENSTKLIVNTSAIVSNSTEESKTKVFYFDRETSEFHHILLKLNYVAGDFKLSNYEKNFFILTQEKTRLRLTIDQIRGPLHFLSAEKDSGSISHSPQMKFLEELEHYSIDRSVSNQVTKLDSNHFTFGTQEYHIDLKKKVVRTCRPFATNFQAKTLQVMCSEEKSLEITDLKHESIQDFKIEYDKLLAVFTRLADIKTDKYEICYIFVDLRLTSSSTDCFGFNIGQSLISSIAMSPSHAYIFTSDGDHLSGVYLKHYAQKELIPTIASGVTKNSFSIRKFGSTDTMPKGIETVPDLELNIIRAGMVNTILFAGSKLLYNRHSTAAISTEVEKEFVCSTGRSKVVGSNYGLFVIKNSGEILPLTPTAHLSSDLQVSSVICLGDGSILVERGESVGFNIIPNSYSIEENRGHRQTIYTLNKGQKIIFHSNFFTKGENYLIEKGSNKIYKLSISSQPLFVQSKTKSKGRIHFQLTEALNQSNTKNFEGVYISSHNSYQQRYSSEVQSKPATIDGSHFLQVDYDPIVDGTEGHFWKFESFTEPNKTLLYIVNRFQPIDIGLSDKTDIVSHIHRLGMDIFFAEGRFLFYKAFSDKLLGEFQFNAHYVTKLIDLVQDSVNENEYSLLARADSISKRSLIKLVFSKDKNNRFQFIREQRLNFTLDEEDNQVKALRIKDDWCIGILKKSFNNTLVILKFNTGEILFDRALVDKFEIMIPKVNSTTEGQFLYVLFSEFGLEEGSQVRIDLESRDVSIRKLDVKLSIGEYDQMKCEQHPEIFDHFSCVFAGVSLHWIDLELNSVKHLKLVKSIKYESYKNMEVKNIAINLNQNSNLNFFIVQFERINEDLDSNHDTAGLLYYSARGENAVKFAHGGITNLDLLDKCVNFDSTPELTSNNTLILTTCSGLQYYNIEHPHVFSNRAWKDDLDKGLNVTMYGVSVAILEFDKKSIHRLYKFTTLVMLIGVSIAISLLLMCWTLIQKKKISIDNDEDHQGSEPYDNSDHDDNLSGRSPSLLLSHRQDFTLPA